MQRQDAIRTFLFVIFFSIGAATLYVSICCDELIRYYRNKQMLKAVQESKNQLESLIADYEALLGQMEKDPNLFMERIAPAALGAEPEKKDVVYPKATPEQLNAAREALTEDTDRKPIEPVVPGWLIQCSEPRRRIVLFLAGAFLILISFIWFGSTANNFKPFRR